MISRWEGIMGRYGEPERWTKTEALSEAISHALQLHQPKLYAESIMFCSWPKHSLKANPEVQWRAMRIDSITLWMLMEMFFLVCASYFEITRSSSGIASCIKVHGSMQSLLDLVSTTCVMWFKWMMHLKSKSWLNTANYFKRFLIFDCWLSHC